MLACGVVCHLSFTGHSVSAASGTNGVSFDQRFVVEVPEPDYRGGLWAVAASERGSQGIRFGANPVSQFSVDVRSRNEPIASVNALDRKADVTSRTSWFSDWSPLRAFDPRQMPAGGQASSLVTTDSNTIAVRMEVSTVRDAESGQQSKTVTVTIAVQ